ncbi:DNA glycosylase AlkZ-like family protein [Pseudorhodoferax sp.]|uniref:DNA glycosylase AlkZ-like family protein n=1 Tax=Pseudorhodoferax sp. TaxID=1993553 RepID=UPI0039E57FD4
MPTEPSLEDLRRYAVACTLRTPTTLPAAIQHWGGSSNASPQLLDGMHYRGLLRVKRRDSGTRVYEAAAHPPADGSSAGSARRATALIDLVVRKYAPLLAASLTHLVRLLGYGAHRT